MQASARRTVMTRPSRVVTFEVSIRTTLPSPVEEVRGVLPGAVDLFTVDVTLL